MGAIVAKETSGCMKNPPTIMTRTPGSSNPAFLIAKSTAFWYNIIEVFRV
jgi:hypothetical protein